MNSYVVIWTAVLIFHVEFGRSSSQIQAFFQRREGEYLANSVIRTEKTRSELECGSLCARESSCVSVNYKESGENRGMCELNNSTLEDSKENREKTPGFVNLSILKSTYGSNINPGKDCVDIKKKNRVTKDGEYWIHTTTKTLNVYCFMDKDKPSINLALNKPTNQSSTFVRQDGPLSSSFVVDGDTGHSINPCSHTMLNYEPWWRVDLQKVFPRYSDSKLKLRYQGEWEPGTFLLHYMISKLLITNRIDCCGEVISGFEIRIGSSLNDNGNANPTCGGKYSLATAETREIVCDPALPGEYVNIVIHGRSEYLTLCEVQVFAQTP